MTIKVAARIPSDLTPEDLKNLQRFRITNPVLRAARLERLTNHAARKRGFTCKDAPPDADFGGVLFPYLDENGNQFNARIRRDIPETDDVGKEHNKYLSLSNLKAKRRGFYILPADRVRLKEDPKVRALLMEAEKSVLAVASYVKRSGNVMVPIGMGGCAGWHGIKDDIDLLRGRAVSVLLDANVADNAEVQNHEIELVNYMKRDLGCCVSVLHLPPAPGVNGPDDYLARCKDLDFKRLFHAPPLEPWLDLVGVSWEEYQNAKPPRMFIEHFLQEGGVTMFGALPSALKTWLLLSEVKALLTGEMLFGHFKVTEPAARVIYLTPEVTLAMFKQRLERMGLGPFIKNRQLLVRTLSQSRIELNCDALMLSAHGAHVFLDTVIRFMHGDENENKANDTGLAADCFGLLRAGALTVNGAHHSVKASRDKTYMTLESVLRGAGDLGGFARVVYGLRKLSTAHDKEHTRVLVECVKPGDFDPPEPFILEGRPYINQGRGLWMDTEPGQVHPDTLAAVVKAEQKKSGRKKSPEKLERKQLMADWIKEGKTEKEIAAALRAKEMPVPKLSTIKKEMSEVRREMKF